MVKSIVLSFVGTMCIRGKTLCPALKGWEWGYLVSTERDWGQECYHGKNLEGVILFVLWCTFLVPSLKSTAPIFLELLLIECHTVLVEPSMTPSLSFVIDRANNFLFDVCQYWLISLSRKSVSRWVSMFDRQLKSPVHINFPPEKFNYDYQMIERIILKIAFA